MMTSNAAPRTVSVTMDFLPPQVLSPNNSHGSHFHKTKAKNALKESIHWRLQQNYEWDFDDEAGGHVWAERPMEKAYFRVLVHYWGRWGDRDRTNWVASLKYIEDSFVNFGVIVDDSREHVLDPKIEYIKARSFDDKKVIVECVEVLV